jgi:hypothetical protein
MKIDEEKLPVISDDELKKTFFPTEELIKTALDDFDEQIKLDEMKEWTAEQQSQYLCPDGVMTIEEFRELGLKMIDEVYDELEFDNYEEY